MTLPTGKFRHLDSATLSTMRTAYEACLAALALNQSYSISGRTLTRINIDEAANILDEILYAQKIQSGALQRIVYSDMSR